MADVNLIAPGTQLLNIAQQIEAWSKILQRRCIPDDIYFQLAGNYIGDKKALPNAITMTVKEGESIGAGAFNIPIILPAGMTGLTVGQQITLGSETDLQVKGFQCYYNDYGRALRQMAYGRQYLTEVEPYKLFSEITPNLSVFFKELFGYYYRQAIVEKYSGNLTDATYGVSVGGTVLSSAWHPIVLVKGLTRANQPSYDSTLSTYTQNLGNALAAAVTGYGGDNGNGACDPHFLLALAEHASFKQPIAPLSYGGRDSYLFAIPSNQTTRILDPAITGSLGSVWKSTSALNKEEASIPGVLGRVRNVILVEDNRSPTIVVGGSEGAWTLTAKYRKPGETGEERYLGGDNEWDVGVLIGKSMVADVDPEPVHYEVESQNYKKIIGKGGFGSRGFNRVEFDITTPTDSSIIQQGSIMCLFKAQSTTF